MDSQRKMGPEAVAAAPKPQIVASPKPTLVHSVSERCFASPYAEESENPLIGQPLCEFRKAGGYTVRVQIQTYKGTTYLDIRQWAERGGELSPTRTGITVPLDRVRELGEALRRVDVLTEPDRTHSAA